MARNYPGAVLLPDALSVAERLDIETMLVGGPIDVIDPYEDSVILVINDEAKLMGLSEMNRRTHVFIDRDRVNRQSCIGCWWMIALIWTWFAR